MPNAQVLNLGTAPQRDADADAKRVEDRFHADDLIDQTRAEVRRVRLLVDQQYEDHQRRTKMLSIALGVLLVILAAAIWYTYPAVQSQKYALAEMVGLKSVSSGLGDRLNTVEAKLTASLPALSDQMERLQTDMKANMQSARTQAQSVANQVGQRVRDDVNRSMQAVQSRLAGVESNQKEASAHVAQLEQQVAKLNGELAALREQSGSATEELKQLKESQQTSSRELSGMNERLSTNQTALSNLASRTERNKIDFAISNRKPTEIAPDMFLTVKRADVGNQELDALLQLGAKGKTLPIRGQGVRKPVLFYMPEENRPVELVITDISKNKISGYLMMPGAVKTASK